MTDIIKIPPMGIKIRQIGIQLARVPRKIDPPLHHLDILLGDRDIIPRADVILRAQMPEAQQQRRQPRNRIIEMRDAVIPALVLIGDVVADLPTANARLAVRVQFDIAPGIAELGGGDGGDGAAEGVARDDELSCRVGVGGRFHGGEDACAGFEPAAVEARADAAGGADVGGGDGGEFGVGDEIADGGGAAEGEDDEGAGGVRGDVAGYVCEEGAGGG